MRILTEYTGVGEFADRSAVVVIDSNGDHGVKYCLDEKVVDYRIFPDHSVYFAQDAAENWITGIINPKDLEVTY